MCEELVQRSVQEQSGQIEGAVVQRTANSVRIARRQRDRGTKKNKNKENTLSQKRSETILESGVSLAKRINILSRGRGKH